MKNFVFNFISGEQTKFQSGEELYNLVATCIAFDQNVSIILHEHIVGEDSLNFLSEILEIPGQKRLISNTTTLLNEVKINNDIETMELKRIQEAINQADFYLEC